MSIPNRQVGEGPDVQLLRQISKQLDTLIKVVGKLVYTTTTTTTIPVTTTTTTTEASTTTTTTTEPL